MPTDSDLFQLWTAMLAAAHSVLGAFKVVGGYRAIFNTPSTYTLTLPADVTQFDAGIWCGVGGAGGASSPSVAASGGGGAPGGQDARPGYRGGNPIGASAFQKWLVQPGDAGTAKDDFFASLKGVMGSPQTSRARATPRPPPSSPC